MSKRRFPLDRSAMFTCLLDLSQEYRKIDSRVGERITTTALSAWYASSSTDMYAFTKWWLGTVPLATRFPAEV